MFGVLLFASRAAILRRRMTRFSTAIGILHREYRPEVFYCTRHPDLGTVDDSPAHGPLPQPSSVSIRLCVCLCRAPLAGEVIEVRAHEASVLMLVCVRCGCGSA